MLLFAAIAFATPTTDAAPMQGFLHLWVDPSTFPATLEPATPRAVQPPTHAHALTPGPLVILTPTEDVKIGSLVSVLEADEDLIRVELNPEGTALLVEHPDVLSLITLPFETKTVGEVVDLLSLPTGVLDSMIAPARPAGLEGLSIDNHSTARAIVWIGDTRIGEIAPHGHAEIRGVSPGTYLLGFELPNGHIRTSKVATAIQMKP